MQRVYGLEGFRGGVFTHAKVFLRGNDLQQRENGGDRFTMVARCHYGPFLQNSRLLCLGEGKYITFRALYTLVLLLLGKGVK